MHRTKTLTGPGGLADRLGPSIKAAAGSEAYGELARLDASVAWMVWNANFGFIAALFGHQAST